MMSWVARVRLAGWPAPELPARAAAGAAAGAAAPCSPGAAWAAGAAWAELGEAEPAVPQPASRNAAAEPSAAQAHAMELARRRLARAGTVACMPMGRGAGPGGSVMRPADGNDPDTLIRLPGRPGLPGDRDRPRDHLEEAVRAGRKAGPARQ